MRPGYTLVEMLVVMAVLGVMAAAAVPALGVWLDDEPTPSEAVAGLLREARSRAIETARPVTLTIDPATGGWLFEAEEAVPVEGWLELDGATLHPARDRLVVRFGPTGGADGGVIGVRQGDRRAVVRADRWTGEVSVEGS